MPNSTPDPPEVTGAWSRSRCGTRCACTIRPRAGPDGPVIVLTVAGEIDLLTYPVLHAALHTALFETVDTPHHDVVVDLAAVTFCCVRGYVLLTDFAEVAAGTGAGYALTSLPSHLRRIAKILRPDLDRLLPYPAAAAAVIALRAAQTEPARPAEPGPAKPDRVRFGGAVR